VTGEKSNKKKIDLLEF